MLNQAIFYMVCRAYFNTPPRRSKANKEKVGTDELLTAGLSYKNRGLYRVAMI
jgi:hypothetical protein